MKKILFIAIVSAVVFSNCKEELHDPVYLFESSKDFFGFKDSSTWKYELAGEPTEKFSFKSSNYIKHSYNQ